MVSLGVPYSMEYIDNWEAEMDKQAEEIAGQIKREINVEINSSDEIVALIAYLQRLGIDIKAGEASAATKATTATSQN